MLQYAVNVTGQSFVTLFIHKIRIIEIDSISFIYATHSPFDFLHFAVPEDTFHFKAVSATPIMSIWSSTSTNRIWTTPWSGTLKLCSKVNIDICVLVIYCILNIATITTLHISDDLVLLDIDELCDISEKEIQQLFDELSSEWKVSSWNSTRKMLVFKKAFLSCSGFAKKSGICFLPCMIWKCWKNRPRWRSRRFCIFSKWWRCWWNRRKSRQVRSWLFNAGIEKMVGGRYFMYGTSISCRSIWD